MTAIATIQKLIEPTIEAMNLALWGCDLHQAGKYTVLCVYVDGKDGAGVTLDACAKVSREISAILDVEDPISGRYQLEVSSPGIERPLYTLAQFSKYIGQDVKVKLHVAQQGRRQFVGRIEKIDNEQVFFMVEDDVLAAALSDIQKAKLVMNKVKS